MLKDLLLACLSAVLLILSFPNLDFSVLIWIGMVPLFLAIAGKGVLYGFLISYLSGGIFFIGIFSWIFKVPGYTILHHLLLDVYLGAFYAIFGLLFNLISKRLSLAAAFWSAPFIWISLEYLRSNLFFMALPWGLLSHSQYQNLTIIQFASFTGAYGVSFLIVLVNSAIAFFLKSLLGPKEGDQAPVSICGVERNAIVMLLITATLTGSALFYGYISSTGSADGQPLKVSVVQGNIQQVKKWNRKHRKQIVNTHIELTRKISGDHPDLIIWPETAVPLSINRHPKLYGDLMQLARSMGAYLLIGSAEGRKFKKNGNKQSKYYNSALLLTPDYQTGKNQRYDKTRLMPFGEYLPAKEIIPWAYLSVADVNSYAAGEKFTVFQLPAGRFAVTICWENLFPDMVRKFAGNGAQFIVNITNEAWFGKTAAPYQFLSMSVLRAVENRMPVIRCANTGISCFIAQNGRIIDRVRDNLNQDIFVSGVLTREIFLTKSQTFYTKHGDIIVYIAFLVTFLFLAFIIINGKKQNGAAQPSLAD